MEDYYTILGLDPGASSQSIKIAYRRLARETHPDLKVHSSKTEKDSLSVQMAQLNEAYSVLSDTRQKREYDEKLRVQGLLVSKDTPVKPEGKPETRPSAAPRVRVRPHSEVDSTVVSEFSNHLRATLLSKRKDFSWKEKDLEGFDWALEALFWSSHYCVALRGFTAVNSATARKFLNYSEIVVADQGRLLRKSYFLFLLPFHQLSEWESVSAQCQRFVAEENRAKLSHSSALMILLDLHHGRTLRFGAQIKEKRFGQLLQWIGTRA